MTVETQINRAQYVGNGHAADFPVPFPVPRPEHLRIFFWANGIQTEITEGFSVVGAGSPSVTVAMDRAPAEGVVLTILRRVPLVQPMVLKNGGNFNAEILEGSADNLVMQIQQVAEGLDRALIFPEGMPGERPDYASLAGLRNEAEAARDHAREEAGRAEAMAAKARNARVAARCAATQSRNAAALAGKWAANPEDEEVRDGLYSARHYAAKAALMVSGGGPPAAGGSGIPSGGIIMWSGNAEDLAPGWALCDGLNNTPDLRGKFIVGAGLDHAPGDTGGSADLSGLTVGATTLTTAQMPSHSHTPQLNGNAVSAAGTMITGSSSGNLRNANLNTTAAGGGASHTHALSGAAEGSNLPPYYALCYIMKL